MYIQMDNLEWSDIFCLLKLLPCENNRMSSKYPVAGTHIRQTIDVCVCVCIAGYGPIYLCIYICLSLYTLCFATYVFAVVMLIRDENNTGI